MNKKFKYENEALGVIHQEALESFRIGAINEARMREYDELCLAKSAAPVSRVPTQKPAVVARSGVPLYAQGK